MTATLEQQQSKIDCYLAIFDTVTVFDRHHRSILQRLRDARKNLTTARDLRSAVEFAEHLNKAYDPKVSPKLADRARSFLEDLPDVPFRGPVDLEIPANSMFRSIFSM